MAVARYMLPIWEIRAMAERNNLLENAAGAKAATQTQQSAGEGQNSVALAWFVGNRAGNFAKILKQSYLGVFAGMAKGGRCGHWRPPEIDCISAQIH